MGGVDGVAAVMMTLDGCGLGGVWRTLYVDNWYTDMALLTLLFAQHIYVIGTVTLTKKKARVSKDFPYSKLSGAAMRPIPRGWFWRATWQLVQADSLSRP